MDIHRARFVPYPSSPITSIAFTRSNDKNVTGDLTLRLALARNDGSIEIWNPLNGSWIQETRFITDDIIPEALVWTQDPDQTSFDGSIITGQYRLFSYSAGGKVTEWDLERGIRKRQNTGNLAEVWCLTAQPRAAKSDKAQDLVAGCGDGTLAVLTTDEDDLQFKRYLARVSGKKARCLTIAYQKPEVLIAGFADSMIRVYDTRSGSILRTMSLGASIPGASKSNLVWKLLSLPNGDIVSGDSNGELRIWDGKSLSVKQRLSGHDRDCLDLAASSDGQTLFSCGVDGRIASYRLSAGDNGRSTWAKTSHRRVSQEAGSVRALAAYDGKNMSMLVASSNDPAPILAPLRGYGKENLRHLPFLPHHTQVVSSPNSRLMATWWDNCIFIYRFDQNVSLIVLRNERKGLESLVARIQLKNSRIRDVSISPDGDLIAASSSTGVHLYQLAQPATPLAAMKIRRVKLPNEFTDDGAKITALVGQDGQGTWLAAVSSKNDIIVTRLVLSQSKAGRYEAAKLVIELERAGRKRQDQTGFKAYNATIAQLMFSEDGSMLVAGDVSGHVDYWELNGDFDLDQQCVEVAAKTVGAAQDSDDDSSDDDEEDDTQVMLYGQTWKLGGTTLPKLESTPLVMTFRPQRVQNLIDSQLGDEAVPAHRRLLIITARHQMYEFDVRLGQLSSWGKQHTSSSLPPAFSEIKDRVMGAYWDPRERLWLYGSNFVIMLDVSEEVQTQATSKRKRQEEPAGSNKRNKGSGAGDVITNGHDVGGPYSARKTNAGKTTALDLRNVNGFTDNDNGDSIELALPQAQQAAGGHLKHWSTFKYRQILGIVALCHGNRAPEESQDVLEVVIVERPSSERRQQKKQKKKQSIRK